MNGNVVVPPFGCVLFCAVKSIRCVFGVDIPDGSGGGCTVPGITLGVGGGGTIADGIVLDGVCDVPLLPFGVLMK